MTWETNDNVKNVMKRILAGPSPGVLNFPLQQLIHRHCSLEYIDCIKYHTLVGCNQLLQLIYAIYVNKICIKY
jgi:hypothetical protein